ncbi:hypothetical protein RhiJN_00173 [Ceratobasidium sp. AG-Ba]|nr:hypothetical protein RhiJN_00173 [Ceratobasidium sp. AG-Ba]QRW01206.1 hypothetical protein RhiLY_00203 [Ceratobasidium sp. AG-Ba]
MNISALVGIIDLGYRFTPSAFFTGRDAGVLLDETNRILEHASSTLSMHQMLLPSPEYETFRAQLRVLHMKVQAEEDIYRNFNPRLIRQGRTPSEVNDTKESVQLRVLDLLNEAEEYKSRVMTASNRVSSLPTLAFPDEQPSDSQTAPLEEVEWPRPPSDLLPPPPILSSSVTARSPSPRLPLHSSLARTNLGLMKRIGPTSFFGSFVPSQSTVFDDKKFMFSVSHIAQEGTDGPSSPSEKRLYQRVLTFNNRGQLWNLVDPQLRELSDDQVNVGEDLLVALLEAAHEHSEELSKDID